MTKTDKALPTLVTFLLDRSGSMSSIRNDTIGGFNAYLKNLQDEGGDAIKFTRLQFDSQAGCSIQKDCVAEAVGSVKPLDHSSYQPRGGTPLIEAAHKTIDAVEASLKKFDVKHQVVVCIQTDGEENQSSSEYTWEGLKALIEKKTKAGWVFNFMGTGIDAYAQGGRMGIAQSNTMSTGKSREHVTASYAAMGKSTMRFAASGAVADSGFLDSERASSGEHTIHGAFRRAPLSAPQPQQGIDLSPGGSASLSGLDLTP